MNGQIINGFAPPTIPHRVPVYAALLLLGLCALSPLPAQSAPQRAIDVAIAAPTLGPAPAAAIVDLITFAAGLQLERRGLTSVVLKADSAALRDPAGLLAKPESKGSSYLLVAESSERGRVLTLALAWYEGRSGTWIAKLRRSGAEDMQMDALILQAMSDLFDAVASASPPISRPREAAPVVSDAPPLVSDAPPLPSDAPSLPSDAPSLVSDAPPLSSDAPSLVSDAPPLVSDAPSLVSDAPSLPSDAPPLRSDSGSLPSISASRGLEVGFGGGPFLAGGALGPFFKAAGGISGRASWFFQGKFAALGLGILAGGQLFQAQGPLESATGILAPFALDVRLVQKGSANQFKPYLRFDAGAALMRVQPGLYPSITTVMPFAQAGLGIGRRLGSLLTLSVELAYQVFLDGKDLIMGLSPSIELALPVGKLP